eukprot:c2754_g1_i2.p1 GENE.c2754_g1_i2~~c2754_g1_i2.p1  ORF type:complete len:265 (+),score=47.50 c2754_g1_i2:236-1030(+)
MYICISVHLLLFSETQNFLRMCLEYGWYDMFATVTAHVLKKFMSVTDTNAFLGRGQMFVFSQMQFRRFLPGSTNFGSLLDIGAGDGEVTLKMSPLFKQVVTTEVATHMCRRLNSKGLNCIQTCSLSQTTFPVPGFDVISCLNVLDRCDTPLKLLDEMKSLLNESGTIVLAVVLPWCPFVENGTQQRKPTQILDIPPGCPCQGVKRMSFEGCVCYFVQRVLEPSGLTVSCVSRVPYLCKGDDYRPYYILDDAIFICHKTINTETG